MSETIDLISPDGTNINSNKVTTTNYDGVTSLVIGTVITLSGKHFEFFDKVYFGLFCENLEAGDNGTTIELFASMTKAGINESLKQTITITDTGDKEYDLTSNSGFNCWKLVITPAGNTGATILINGTLRY